MEELIDEILFAEGELRKKEEQLQYFREQNEQLNRSLEAKLMDSERETLTQILLEENESLRKQLQDESLRFKSIELELQTKNDKLQVLNQMYQENILLLESRQLEEVKLKEETNQLRKENQLLEEEIQFLQQELHLHVLSSSSSSTSKQTNDVAIQMENDDLTLLKRIIDSERNKIKIMNEDVKLLLSQLNDPNSSSTVEFSIIEFKMFHDKYLELFQQWKQSITQQTELQNNTTQFEKEYKLCKEELKRMQEEKIELKQIFEKLTLKLKDKSETIETLSLQNNDLHSKIQLYSNKLEEYSKQSQQLVEFEITKKEVEKLKFELTNLETDYNTVIKEKIDLEEGMHTLHSKKKSLLDQLTQVRVEKEMIQKNVTELQHTIQKLKIESNEKILEAQTEVRKIMEENKQLKKTFKKNQEEWIAIKEENTKLVEMKQIVEAHLEQVNLRIVNLEQKYVNQVEQLQQEMENNEQVFRNNRASISNHVHLLNYKIEDSISLLKELYNIMDVVQQVNPQIAMILKPKFNLTYNNIIIVKEQCEQTMNLL